MPVAPSSTKSIRSRSRQSEDLDGFVFREHFGFRDGISQPVIRGTHRLVQVAPPERDIVEPGEFILGYRNNQGYYPLAISVSAETDFNDRLPDVIAESPSRFPDVPRRLQWLARFRPQRDLIWWCARFSSMSINSTTSPKGLQNQLQARVGPEEWVAAKNDGPMEERRAAGAAPDRA